MPQLTRITAQQVKDSQLFTPGQTVPYDYYAECKDVWITCGGNVIYAGYYGHEESARNMGYESVTAAERSGLIHVSSCYNGIPDIVHLPAHMTKAQKETLFDYCLVHNLPYGIE